MGPNLVEAWEGFWRFQSTMRFSCDSVPARSAKEGTRFAFDVTGCNFHVAQTHIYRIIYLASPWQDLSSGRQYDKHKQPADLQRETKII